MFFLRRISLNLENCSNPQYQASLFWLWSMHRRGRCTERRAYCIKGYS